MQPWTSDTCEANGLRLHYLRTGGPGPAVVLLHGLSASGACWSPLARFLERDYDVVMPDARGHGTSDGPPRGYRYEDHAADLTGLIGRLGLRAPVLVGHSMGGLTAAMVASRPSPALRGVILADPAFLSPERQLEVHASDVRAQHRSLLCQGAAEALAQARLRHPHRSPETLELVTKARLDTRPEAFEVLAPPIPDYRPLVGALRVPSLLVLAERGIVSLETARGLQALNPRLHVERLRNAGHGLQYDQPERFEALVGSFLQSVAAP